MLLTSADRTEIQIAIDGIPISGLLRASIATTNAFAADTFSLTFALGPEASGDMVFWSSVSSASITATAVSAQNYGLTYFDLVTGMIDTIHVNPIQRMVGVEGRDLSSSLINAYHQQDFVNQTASEIVTTIAQYHSLRPVVTATVGNIGRYYTDGYTKLSLGQFSTLQSDWDLVVQLARQSSFDVFVQGRSLFFQPTIQYSATPLFLDVRDVKSMRIERNLDLGASPTATVQSWNSQNMAAYRSNNLEDGTADKVPPSSGAASPFLFSASNYNSEQVNNLAARYAAELARLTTVLELEMPWDLSLAPRTTIFLTGTNSSFDAAYQIDGIERHYSSISGSTQTLRAVQINAAHQI
jgi:hypothetical protein